MPYPYRHNYWPTLWERFILRFFGWHWTEYSKKFRDVPGNRHYSNGD